MQPQRSPLCLSELETKIVRESLLVAGDLLIEPLDRHPVKGGKVGVKDNGLTAKADDGLPGFRPDLSLDGTHRATILHRYNKSIANYKSILGALVLTRRGYGKNRFAITADGARSAEERSGEGNG